MNFHLNQIHINFRYPPKDWKFGDKTCQKEDINKEFVTVVLIRLS